MAAGRTDGYDAIPPRDAVGPHDRRGGGLPPEQALGRRYGRRRDGRRTGDGPRDAGDAANVARSRLVPATVETIQREGDPSTVVPALVKEFDADELLVGPRCGDPGADAALGETARTVLTAVRVPVVVLPLPDL
ncbi:universal stress protein [Haloarculaceae archaeon H-GB2-1]|nr:universal stress protein [Haloarculaceae archaeon H-GB2-1]